MKFSAFVVLSAIASVSGFAPAASGPKSMALNAEAEQSRSAFLAAAGAAVFGAVVAPGVAGAMDQENVSTPTEVWETGKPSEASKERKARYENARNQMNSNFPPIKRLTLERKSPVTRLDLNAPDFNGRSDAIWCLADDVVCFLICECFFFLPNHRIQKDLPWSLQINSRRRSGCLIGVGAYHYRWMSLVGRVTNLPP
jgi:hypothetical protein